MKTVSADGNRRIVIAAGRVALHESWIDGLAQAPQPLVGLLDGRHVGKVMVRVAD